MLGLDIFYAILYMPIIYKDEKLNEPVEEVKKEKPFTEKDLFCECRKRKKKKKKKQIKLKPKSQQSS